MAINVKVNDGRPSEDRLVIASVVSNFIYEFVAELSSRDCNCDLDLASLTSKLDRIIKTTIFRTNF